MAKRYLSNDVEIKKSAKGHKDKIYFATKDGEYQSSASDKQGYSYWLKKDSQGFTKMGDHATDFIFNIPSGLKEAVETLNKIIRGAL